MKVMLRLCLVLSMAMTSVPLAAKSGEFKIATLAPEGTSWMQQMRAAAERIKQASAGRVSLKFYPGGVMGNDQTVLRKLRLGQLQGAAFTGGALVSVEASAGLYNLPMLFRSQREVDHVRAEFDPQITARLEKKGLRVLGISNGGFAYVMSAEPVAGIASLQDNKLWIPEGDSVTAAIFEAAGLQSVPLPLADVYTGLQTGLIDTVATTPAAAIAFQWHTKIRYMVDFPLAFLTGFFVVDAKDFQALSAADQALMAKEISAAFTALDELNQKDDKGARAALQSQGIKIAPLNASEEQHWQRLAETTLARLQKNEDFAADLYQALTRRLATYRGQAQSND